MHIFGAPDMFRDGCAALASAADVSCLEISSRTPISLQTWSVITKVDVPLSNPNRNHVFNIRKNGHCLYNGPAARWRMEHSGTVVHLRDIFYNVCLPTTPALRGISNVAAVTDSTQLSFSTVKDHGDDLPRHRDLSISISWSVVHR